MTVAVCRTLPLERINALKQSIAERLERQYARAEATVIAANHGAVVQNVALQQLPERMSISMDLAVPASASASVAQAHDIASEIENLLRQAIGEDTEIETHLEPQMPHWITSEDVEPDELANIRQILRTAVEKGVMVQDVHNIRARKTAEGIIVNFHCRVSPPASIVAAHDAVDRIEHQLRALYPTISRAVGHLEPIKPAL